MFTAALFTIDRTWKLSRCVSTGEWIKKQWYIHTMEYYSAMKRNTFKSVLIMWTKLESIIQSKVSQKEKYKYCILRYIYQFSSVAQSCLTLCDPMDCSTPGLPVHHQLPGVYSNPCPLKQWCHPTISSFVIPFSSCPQSFPASGSFPMSQLFSSGGQSIGASASASVLPMNTQWLISFRILPSIPNTCWLIKRYIFQSQSVKILPLLILQSCF